MLITNIEEFLHDRQTSQKDIDLIMSKINDNNYNYYGAYHEKDKILYILPIQKDKLIEIKFCEIVKD